MGDTNTESSDFTSEDEGTEDYRRGGYHAVRIGDSFNSGRYVVQSKLGWGHFSTVWLAWDTHHSRYVALKVQKSAQHYTEAALDEITILQQIAEGDKDDKKCVVKLLDHFKHFGPNGQHVCMVFEYLGDNLLTLIKYSDYRGMPINMVKEICYHILVGLDYLHKQLSIIHTDLKPENILLLSMIDPSKDPRKSGAPLILPNSKDKMLESTVSRDTKTSNGDLFKNHKKNIKRKAKQAAHGCAEKEASEGVDCNPETSGAVESSPNASSAREQTSSSAGTSKLSDADEAKSKEQGNRRGSCTVRQKLLASVDNKCKLVDFDLWSFACICFELATGDVLFDPHSGDNFDRDEDHLALMMELLGMMPRKIALGGRYSRDFFNRYGDLRHIRRLRFWPLTKVLTEKYDFSEKDASDMSDFLVSILDFVPEKRPTAGQCLLHPWMNAGPRTLEPSVASSNHNPAAETATSDQKNKDKDEREAMEAGMGNIAINSDIKPLMHSPSNKASQGSRK
ncbi:uncharacterized protein LOC127098487 isoform X2 [Lathyrus oleraceus]|uniref:uncharacterized protein LOC127098487 isoform X2 n=1 Tax=Pisum sativum TaxID=3888 RepID=UPI0021D2DD94|nr:uncharacterized protein LOC127098487 isoform X2 [Pisum sativum]